MSWQKNKDGDLYFQIDKGSANVYQLSDGRWHWEVCPKQEYSFLISLEMDAWWGNETTEQEAKKEVELYFQRFMEMENV